MENSIMEPRQAPASSSLITSEALREHWQSHRRLTRRLIEAFPEKEFFEFSIGGMRTCAALMMELMHIAAPGIKGMVTGVWNNNDDLASFGDDNVPGSKEEVLRIWDAITERIDALWPQIAPERFNEKDKAFGQYEGTILSFVLYFIDNEIHHRGQAYVYLRALGVEPPPFWDRA
jgi:uncharacterized damage-inducible protein DinB